jgi:hypothetical protein
LFSSWQTRGIAARTVGEFTSGFKAEAPRDVSVLVKHRDLASARNALLTVQQELFAREATATEEDEEEEKDEEAEEELGGRIETDRGSRWKLVAQLMLIDTAGAIPVAFIAYLITHDLSYLVFALSGVGTLALLLHLSSQRIVDAANQQE